MFNSIVGSLSTADAALDLNTDASLVITGEAF